MAEISTDQHSVNFITGHWVAWRRWRRSRQINIQSTLSRDIGWLGGDGGDLDRSTFSQYYHGSLDGLEEMAEISTDQHSVNFITGHWMAWRRWRRSRQINIQLTLSRDIGWLGGDGGDLDRSTFSQLYHGTLDGLEEMAEISTDQHSVNFITGHWVAWRRWRRSQQINIQSTLSRDIGWLGGDGGETHLNCPTGGCWAGIFSGGLTLRKRNNDFESFVIKS